jgi:hypothetical protein
VRVEILAASGLERVSSEFSWGKAVRAWEQR